MSRDYVSEFLPDLEEFREKTMRFHNGQMTVPEYKGFSGGYGSYAQRGGKKHMLRLRMAGGRLTKERLSFIVDTCEKYHIDMIKLTTCQSIQLHNLEAEDLCDMIEDAWKADMITRGGGGDFPRNVMATSLTGVTADEHFDVLPYAEAAGDYLMHYIKETKFPRKLKVCFSSNAENEPHATFRDLGFVARPDKRFDVYCAGGLGNNPKLGVKVADAIRPEHVLYYINAMVRCFVTYGDYENRGRARTRYMQDMLGAEGLQNAFDEKLAEIEAEKELDIHLHLPANTVAKTGAGTAPQDSRIFAQKQEGLYAVFYQPIGGILKPAKLKEIQSLIRDMDQVEIRLTPTEGMYIINCNGAETASLLQATSDSAVTAFDRSVSCIGADICQVGIGDSQSMLQECVERVQRESFADGVLPQLHFSGCPSSCSAHQTAPIGFRGGMKQTPDGPKPAFAIFLGGCDRQGQEHIAGTGKPIARKDIPTFLIELGHLVQDADSTYDKWIQTHTEDMEQLIARYTA